MSTTITVWNTVKKARKWLDVGKAVALMAANPSCIKRPVVEYPGGLLVGFKETEWDSVLG